MDSAGNNTTLYDQVDLCPIELRLNTCDSARCVPNDYIKWPIEKCIELCLLNVTSIESILNTVFKYNGTLFECIEHAPVLTNSIMIKGSVLSVLAVLSFFANLATIISLQRDKRGRRRARPLWSAISSLIFHLSIADLLVTIFCFAVEAAWTFTIQWYAGDAVCKILKYLQMVALYLSTFILVLIGVDRWLAVKYPMRSMAKANKSRKLVIGAWILSIILSIPQAIVFHVLKGPYVEDFYQCVTYGSYAEKWQEKTYIILTLVIMFILPLIILVSTYVSTVRTIAKSENIFKAEIWKQEKPFPSDKHRKDKIVKAKIKSLRISVVIVAAFLIWWTPYNVVMIISLFLDPNKQLSEDLDKGIFFFGMSNSLVNPIIYGAFHLWPKRKSNHKQSERESGQQASLLRRGDNNTSSVRLTTIPGSRYSAKYSNGRNVSIL